ncbi:MAG: hypothetical protein AAF289_01150 [Cyanobacteria bacterium P01_A01_bin.135]
MTDSKAAKARIQYSSRDELDIAVITYCRGQSRHELHYRTRLALNGFYAPFAIAAAGAPEEDVRRQASRSIRQLQAQIWEIQEQFFPDSVGRDSTAGGLAGSGALLGAEAYRGTGNGQSNGKITQRQDSDLASSGGLRDEGQGQLHPIAVQQPSNPRPIDEPLREFLGDDAAIMAGLNPFINDLT